jgi:ferredoxin
MKQQPSTTPKYESVAIHYMSGTGNTFRVATWMAEAANALGMKQRIASMESEKPEQGIEKTDKRLVGLFFPTHGFTAPWQAIKFALKMPRGRGVDAICVATRAGTKFGPLFLPGLSGTATFVVALILAIKGYSVRGVLPLNMTSNWTAVHPGYSRSSANAIHARSRIKAARFFGRIVSGETCWINLNNALEFLFGLALLPISIGYILVARFVFAKLFFANERCNGCGLCATSCPLGAISMVGEKSPRPYWRYNCESCMRCMNFCPEKAVEASHSLAVAIYLISTVPVAATVLGWAKSRYPGLTGLDSPTLDSILSTILLLGATMVSYLVLQLLLRISVLNRIVAYTTFTRLFRRYHEPETKLKELVGKGRELKKAD